MKYNGLVSNNNNNKNNANPPVERKKLDCKW